MATLVFEGLCDVTISIYNYSLGYGVWSLGWRCCWSLFRQFLTSRFGFVVAVTFLDGGIPALFAFT